MLLLLDSQVGKQNDWAGDQSEHKLSDTAFAVAFSKVLQEVSFMLYLEEN